jgi:hypothetical protein
MKVVEGRVRWKNTGQPPGPERVKEWRWICMSLPQAVQMCLPCAKVVWISSISSDTSIKPWISKEPLRGNRKGKSRYTCLRAERLADWEKKVR